MTYVCPTVLVLEYSPLCKLRHQLRKESTGTLELVRASSAKSLHVPMLSCIYHRLQVPVHGCRTICYLYVVLHYSTVRDQVPPVLTAICRYATSSLKILLTLTTLDANTKQNHVTVTNNTSCVGRS